jgi:hypothetical protein
MDVEFRTMIQITGTFRDYTVTRVFKCVLDAIDYRDILDANYATVEWKQI